MVEFRNNIQNQDDKTLEIKQRIKNAELRKVTFVHSNINSD